MGNVCFDTSSRVLCNSSDLVYFQPVITEIYYGVWSGQTVTDSIILSTFSTLSGFVGSPLPTPRIYNFPAGYNYKYWCIPDIPNNGNRVISLITNGLTNTVLANDPYYSFYQINPNYTSQPISYGKININGFTYRIYRTKIVSSQITYYVYSF